MARDIEEFLRRAAERRKQKMQQSGQAAQPTPSSQRVRQVIEEVEVIKPRAEASRTMRQQGVAEHVRSHIDTSSIAEHTTHLGERIQNVDEKVASRLQSKFDHEMGELGDSPTVTDDRLGESMGDDISTIATDILKLFSTSNGSRKAILLAEILRRPSFD